MAALAKRPLNQVDGHRKLTVCWAAEVQQGQRRRPPRATDTLAGISLLLLLPAAATTTTGCLHRFHFLEPVGYSVRLVAFPLVVLGLAASWPEPPTRCSAASSAVGRKLTVRRRPGRSVQRERERERERLEEERLSQGQ